MMVSIRHNPPAPPTGTLARTAYNADHVVPVATQTEATAGVATDKLMTPQRTAQAIGAIAPSAHTHTIANVTGLQAALDGKLSSNPTGITGAEAITNIVSLTQAEYDAIPTKSATTFYVVTA